jgi:hypothetical protein
MFLLANQESYLLGIKLVYCLYPGSSVVRFTALAGLYDPTSHVQANQIPERHAVTNKPKHQAM